MFVKVAVVIEIVMLEEFDTEITKQGGLFSAVYCKCTLTSPVSEDA